MTRGAAAKIGIDDWVSRIISLIRSQPPGRLMAMLEPPSRVRQSRPLSVLLSRSGLTRLVDLLVRIHKRQLGPAIEIGFRLHCGDIGERQQDQPRKHHLLLISLSSVLMRCLAWNSWFGFSPWLSCKKR